MNCKDFAQLLRLHRPIPILLLLWPTYWSLLIASHGLPDLSIFCIFTLGVILMRSAGCVMNDLVDRNFDKHVKRTENRPLAKGRVSAKQALCIALLLCLIAFVLVLQLNNLTIALAFIALLLAAIYPFMKRFTQLPQIILGCAFNFGIIMGFSAVQNKVPDIAWLIYIAALFWTVAYDTWYAMEDRADDIKIGIKSSAVLFGKNSAIYIAIFDLLFLLLLSFVGIILNFHLSYYVILFACLPLFIYQQYLGHRKAYISAFNHNHWVGLIVLFALAFQYFYNS